MLDSNQLSAFQPSDLRSLAAYLKRMPPLVLRLGRPCLFVSNQFPRPVGNHFFQAQLRSLYGLALRFSVVLQALGAYPNRRIAAPLEPLVESAADSSHVVTRMTAMTVARMIAHAATVLIAMQTIRLCGS